MGGLGAALYRARSWTAVPFAIALLAVARPSAPLLAWGALLVLCGEALRVSGLRHLDATARGGRLHADALATGGPFRFVRNPIYLGNVLLVAGFLVAGGVAHPAFLACAAAALAIQYGAIIAAEEAFLARRFPEAFARYRARVPRLVPRLLPRRAPYAPATTPRRATRDVLRAEFRTLHTLALLFILIGFRNLLR
jgi:protein-S-isoprenylcysteine O-methyltransferase Ste14